jgi:hypothetical protein
MSHLESIRNQGFCILENVIPSERVAEIRTSVLASVAGYRRDSAADHIGFVPGLISVNQSYAEYLANERLLSIVDSLLGHDVRISFTSAIVNEHGNARGDWHADWPFNQRNAGRVPAPYPVDMVFHLTTLWMLSPFGEQNGGTLVLPKSHLRENNPTGDPDIDPLMSFQEELNVEGDAGSVLVMDSRLWHATSPNQTEMPRVALAVRYAPWWLNLEVLRPESDERKRMVTEPGRKDNEVPSVPREVYNILPDRVKPLYRHWVKGDQHG